MRDDDPTSIDPGAIPGLHLHDDEAGRRLRRSLIATVAIWLAITLLLWVATDCDHSDSCRDDATAVSALP